MYAAIKHPRVFFMHILLPLFFPGPMCALYSRSWGPRKSTSAHAGTGITNPSVVKRRKLSFAFHSDHLCFCRFLPTVLLEVRGHRDTAPVALKATVGHISDGLHWLGLFSSVVCVQGK